MMRNGKSESLQSPAGHLKPSQPALCRQLYRQAQSAFQRGEDENMAKICEAYMLAQEAARTMEEQEAEGWNCLAFGLVSGYPAGLKEPWILFWKDSWANIT